MIKQGSLAFTFRRYLKFLLTIIFASVLCSGAYAEDPMPEGTKGWTYFIELNKVGFVATPEEACALSAANHWGATLLSMQPTPFHRQMFHCFYRNPFGGRVLDYSLTHLECEIGYTAKSPGVCVKGAEASRPLSCSPDEPGFALANPVVVSSGAKVQTETDFPGLPNGLLRVTRTYRTLRDGGMAQSAGQGWSFSFDRALIPVAGPYARKGDPPVSVKGAYGDGTDFDFSRQNSETFVSRYDKQEKLQSLNAAFEDWRLTTRDGTIERFRKVNGKILLLSSHTKEGVGQFFTYTAENKLANISDASGRTLTVTWAGDVVASITGATGSVRFHYEMAELGRDAQLPGTERLTAVDVLDETERLVTTRRYHYEDPTYRYLLTGITDENGVRFATYGYDEFGRVIRSEHAGGANRHTFAYPEREKRIVTDPLGTQRQIDFVYGNDSLGRVVGASQPAGAGCGPGYSQLTYDTHGHPSSSTDFNDKKTCFINDPMRGLVTSVVSGLTTAAQCPASISSSIAPTSRRISIQWHPDLELETAVASAKQIARYVYNGQEDSNGNVVSCAENATLPNGKPIVPLCQTVVRQLHHSN